MGSFDDKDPSSPQTDPLLCLPSVEELERIACGAAGTGGDLAAVRAALEAVVHLAANGDEAADLEAIAKALASLDSEPDVSAPEKGLGGKGFEEYDSYFHVVRRKDHPARTLAQGLLTSYGNFLRQIEASHSLTPTERGILRSALQNLAADLQEALAEKGES